MIIALLANFVLPVILALILTRVFSLNESLEVRLLLVSLVAGAPVLPKTAVIAKIDSAAATALMVLMIVLNFNDVVGLLGTGGLLASLILIILITLGGYLLGRFGKAEGWLQALGVGQRNIAAAMVVASTNIGNDEIVMVVVFSLIGMVVLIPLAMELGKRRIQATDQENEENASVA